MKWLNIKGLVICIIVFILLSNYLNNIYSWGDSGIAVLLQSLEDMVNEMKIGRSMRNGDGTAIYFEGHTVIAFLISLLIYLTVFLKKKK